MLRWLLFFVLGFNLVACLLLGVAVEASLWHLQEINVSARYTALDRAGVINRQALLAFNPKFGANDRFDVPVWIAESALQSEKRSTKRAFVVAVINAAMAVVLFVVARRKLASVSGGTRAGNGQEADAGQSSSTVA